MENDKKRITAMKMYRQQKIIEALLKFRLRKFNFDHIKIEVYDRFDGDHYMCRVEVFKGGKGIVNRVLKHEECLTDKFVFKLENKLSDLVIQKGRK